MGGRYAVYDFEYESAGGEGKRYVEYPLCSNWALAELS